MVIMDPGELKGAAVHLLIFRLQARAENHGRASTNKFPPKHNISSDRI